MIRGQNRSSTSPCSSTAVFHWHFQQPRRVSDSTGSAISTSHIQIGVFRIRNKVQRGKWLAGRSSQIIRALLSDMWECPTVLFLFLW